MDPRTSRTWVQNECPSREDLSPVHWMFATKAVWVFVSLCVSHFACDIPPKSHGLLILIRSQHVGRLVCQRNLGNYVILCHVLLSTKNLQLPLLMYGLFITLSEQPISWASNFTILRSLTLQAIRPNDVIASIDDESQHAAVLSKLTLDQ